MTAAEVKNYVRTQLVRPRNITQEINSLDAIIDLISQSSTSSIPEWIPGLTFNADGTGAGKNCTYEDVSGKTRFWKSKTNGNLNNAPPTAVDVDEDDFWKEVSPASGSAIKRYQADGLYGEGLIIVYEDSISPRFLVLDDDVPRPFESTDLTEEIEEGTWIVIGTKLFLGEYTSLGSLESTHPTAEAGQYAYVNNEGEDAVKYIWDSDDGEWVLGSGSTVVSWSETQEGIGEIANQAESQTWVDPTIENANHTRALTPRGFRWAWNMLLSTTSFLTSLLDNLGVMPDRFSASVSSGTLTLDLNYKRRKKFVVSAAQSSAFAIAITNGGSSEEWNLYIPITGTVPITMTNSSPNIVLANRWEKAAGRWNDSTKVFTVVGATGSWFKFVFNRIDSSTIEVSVSSDYFI